MKKLPFLLLLLPLSWSSPIIAGKKEADPKGVVPNGRFVGDGAVKPTRLAVQPVIDKHLKEAQAKTMKELLKANGIPALGKTPARRKGVFEPWLALEDIESYGLTLAEFAKKGPDHLGLVLDLCQNVLERPHGHTDRIKPGKLAKLDDHAAFMVQILDLAKELNDQAFAKIKSERGELFRAAANFPRSFGPQAEVNERTRTLLQSDKDFFNALEKIDWAKLIASAQVLASLTHSDYLGSLQTVLAGAEPIADKIPGVTGDILYKKETRHGLILIGGKGPNTYDIKVPVALLIDLGGNDVYKGQLAASYDSGHPNSVLIDLAGNDRYECDEMGLATGRLGVGLVYDVEGDDTYKLAPGSGGVGLGGIGVLIDATGDDVYEGTRFTQGAAVQGIGLLWDVAGNDTHRCWGFALGVGGPGGVGLVLDNAGKDNYRCGFHFPSGYNQSDAPNAKPGDPNFQWDAFGLAMGLGRRVFPPDPDSMAYNLAGGIGMVIDLEGDDRYESSNFSQACGYFYGTGLLLDLAGNDHYQAARYGQASGAHYGMGLFIDYQGKDTYSSSGPTYNCAAAWDRSAFLFIDAGGEDDVYHLEKSAGLGRADIGSWAVFADLGGNDRYIAPGGMASTSKDSLAIFFDRAGNDDYEKTGKMGKHTPANGLLQAIQPGGLFVDLDR